MSPPRICLGVSWIEPNGLGVVNNGLVELALSQVSVTSIVVSLGLRRGEANNLCTISNGSIEVTLQPINDSSGMVRLGTAPVETNSLRAVNHSLVQVAVPAVGATARAICLGHHRIKLYGPVTVGDRLFEFAFSQVSLAPVGVRLSVLWMQTNGLGVHRLSLPQDRLCLAASRLALWLHLAGYS